MNAGKKREQHTRKCEEKTKDDSGTTASNARRASRRAVRKVEEEYSRLRLRRPKSEEETKEDIKGAIRHIYDARRFTNFYDHHRVLVVVSKRRREEDDGDFWRVA